MGDFVLPVVFAYILGSIPSAIWISKWIYGVDICQVGSCNPGMTNVLRTLGWKPAVPVALLDVGKGFSACWIAAMITRSPEISQEVTLAAGLVSVLGHSFTVFAGFRGGKGVLTGFGVFLYFVPISGLAALTVWSLCAYLTRYVSFASILAALSLPIFIGLENLLRPEKSLVPVLVVALALCSFVIIRHRNNISRLLKGTESKLGNKR